jgi:hypothetical protein
VGVDEEVRLSLLSIDMRKEPSQAATVNVASRARVCCTRVGVSAFCHRVVKKDADVNRAVGYSESTAPYRLH